MTKQDFVTLYLLCFPEDTLQDAERIWRLCATGKLLFRSADGRPAAMLLLLPARLCTAFVSYGLYYIFAACTHPAFRRRGMMEELLQTAYTTALADGMQGVFLRPASENLTRYYMQRNFAPFCRYQTEPLPASAPIAAESADFPSFCRLRSQYMPAPHIVWPPAFLELNYQYMKTAACKNGLIVYETTGDALCVREMFGPAGNALAAGAAKQHGSNRILCRRFGRGAPYALARSAVALPETYVGLTLDAF